MRAAVLTFGTSLVLAGLTACGDAPTAPVSPEAGANVLLSSSPGGTANAIAITTAARADSADLTALAVGDSGKYQAALSNTSGAWVSKDVKWHVSDTAVATLRVSGTGSTGGEVATVYAKRAGQVVLTATTLYSKISASRTLRVTAHVGGTATDTPEARRGYYVAPGGTSSNAGTVNAPWDLRTALAQPARVAPGDTIWVRGGTYKGCFTSQLTGTASAPIVVRAYPGERATLDNGSCNDPALTANGAYTWFWGLEVTNSAPHVDGPLGINVFGDYLRFINLVIHDASATGIGSWAPAAGGEIYGTLVYNNGRKFNLDHGIYTQNVEGQKVLADNLIFNNWSYGIHAYGSDAATVRNYLIEGNVAFNNGAIGENGAAPNLFAGAGSQLSGIVVRQNVAYHRQATSGNVWLGYSWGPTNRDVTIADNYIVGGEVGLRVWKWASASVTGNVVQGSGQMVNLMDGTGGYTWRNNTFYRDRTASAWYTGTSTVNFDAWHLGKLGAADAAPAPRPTGAKVFVRPNKYEPGRANVAVFNWDRAASVAVDLSSVLRPGDAFEVRNAQNYYGAPVASGRYSGAVVLPMSVTPAQPTRGSAKPVVSTSDFQAFVVLKK